MLNIYIFKNHKNDKEVKIIASNLKKAMQLLQRENQGVYGYNLIYIGKVD